MELLVVIAIISIVASVAIPSLMLTRMGANEAAAILCCRRIAEAESAYAAAHGGAYAGLLVLVEAGLLAPEFGDGSINNYRFSEGDVAGTEADGFPPKSFGFVAEPLPGHGRYVYAVAPDRVVRYQAAMGGFSLPGGISQGDPVERSH